MKRTLLAVCISALAAAARADEPAPRFGRDILPILAENCLHCHGPDEQSRKAKLRLDTREGATAKRGYSTAIIPGNARKSEVLLRITSEDATEVMPPPATGKKLTAEQIATLRRWIDSGAEWGKHWAYEKPIRPPPPAPPLEGGGWIRNPIDNFILVRLNKECLQPSPEADRIVLLRRVYLDLIGLPPTPEQVDQFLRDKSPDAYDKVVDHLLGLPQYGERWARPWLDAARYADSHGFQRDDLRDLWPYRDWVIKALNDDMPFDRFTIEQIAGDLLPNASSSQKVATGFHRCTTTNVEAGVDREEGRVNQVFDRVNTTATVWLGTTMECAQCHSHKYDPFTQKEYYQLFAYFNNTPRETDFTTAKATAALKFLGPYLPLSKDKKMSGDENTADEDDAQTGKKQPPRHLWRSLVMQESAPRPTFLLKRGNFLDRGERVEAGTPSILGGTASGTRLDFAQWLVSPDNPLTARVIVNRIWAEYFGRGIVATVEDFGAKGERPTHPELLDWLAVELMHPSPPLKKGGQGGWHLKHIHRLIVTSATYRQSSKLTPELRAKDDQNRLLARGPRLRLDAEAIRDNALAISGLLSLKQGGPPVRPPQPAGLWSRVGGEQYTYVESAGEDRYRRGIYVLLRRSAPYPSLINFDASARASCTVKRNRSNTPLQALTLLNDAVFVEAASALAKRVSSELPGAEDEEKLIRAFRLCVARPPRADELTILRSLLEQQRAARRGQPELNAWTDVASALLNLDETITKN